MDKLQGVVLCSKGNYIQHPVISYDGKEYENKRKKQSFYFTAQINAAF